MLPSTTNLISTFLGYCIASCINIIINNYNIGSYLEIRGSLKTSIYWQGRTKVSIRWENRRREEEREGRMFEFLGFVGLIYI